METLKLTPAQEETIKKINEAGFQMDEKNSGFEKEFDGTYFFTYYAKHGMGVSMIQSDGEITVGNLI